LSVRAKSWKAPKHSASFRIPSNQRLLIPEFVVPPMPK
jgi:hypothetical protein